MKAVIRGNEKAVIKVHVGKKISWQYKATPETGSPVTAAKIVDCEAVPKAKKLLKLTLNDGNANRTVASGIAKFYTPEELKGKTVILVSNLKPATLCGIESQGMILAADCGEDVKVIFLDNVPAGSKIR